MRLIHALLVAGATAITSACASSHPELLMSERPELEIRTAVLDDLLALPPPRRQLTAAVYSFEDQTGQNKPNDTFAEYSRAVTQGGASLLMTALERAGAGNWFSVVERTRLPALLQERKIVRETREQYGANDLPPLPPLMYAGLIIDGGIIGYDSNTLTGGFGARYLGTGGFTNYRRDSVTVFVRAISVQTGRVLKSVLATKTIYSVAGDLGTFRFVGFKDLLEIETGVTTNEPATLATKQAVEKAVYSLLMEGLIAGFWELRDSTQAGPLIQRYLREKEGVYGVRSVRATAEDLKSAAPEAPGAPAPIPPAPAAPDLSKPAAPPFGTTVPPASGNTPYIPPTLGKEPVRPPDPNAYKDLTLPGQEPVYPPRQGPIYIVPGEPRSPIPRLPGPRGETAPAPLRGQS